MPLSEHEQKLLDEMERSLYDSDADFLSSSGRERSRVNYRALVLGLLSALGGIAVVIAGVSLQQPIVGVLGFVVMFCGVLIALRPAKPFAGLNAEDARNSFSNSSADSGHPRLMDRINARWDKRQEGRH